MKVESISLKGGGKLLTCCSSEVVLAVGNLDELYLFPPRSFD